MTDSRYSDLEKREPVFEAARQGKVRFVLATTQRAGVGVNIQDRLVALHHVDAPWTAADMDQREGRIHRQGNLVIEFSGGKFKPRIIGWGVLRSFDSGQYERLSRKAKIQRQFRLGEAVGETIEDDDDITSYAQAAANLTGNPLFKKKAELEQKIRELTGSLEDFQQGQVYLQRKAEDAERWVKDATKQADRLEDFVDGPMREFIESPSVTVDRRTATTEEDINALLKDTIDEASEDAYQILEGESERGRSFRRSAGFIRVNGESFNLIVYGEHAKDGSKDVRFKITHPTMLSEYSRDAVKSHIGIINAIRDTMGDIESAKGQIARFRSNAKQYEAEAAGLRQKIGGKFEGEDQLDQLKRDLNAVDKELAAQGNDRQGEDEQFKSMSQEQLGRAYQPPKKKDGPTSAPDTGPERSRRPVERFMDALDAMERSARDRIRRRQLPRGRDIGGTTLPEDVADIVIVGAAKLLKGTTKFGVWSKEMANEFGKRIKSRIREVWSQSRSLAQDITDGLENPEPTVERVKRRIADAEDQDKAPTPGSTPETRAVHIAYRAGLRAARDELPAIKQKLSDALKLQGKARADTIQGIRLEIRRLVEENLPIEYRGRFLPEVTRATTYARLAQAVNKIRREVARSTAAQDIRQIRRMTKYAKLLSPRPPAPGRKSPRAEFNDMLKRVVDARDQLLRTGRGIVPTDQLEDAAAEIREFKEDMGSLIADAMALRKSIALAKVQTAAEHAEDLAEAIRAHKPSKADGSPTDVRTGAAGSANLLYTDLRNLAERLEGGQGVAYAMMFKRMGAKHESYLSALRDAAEKVDAAARAAGFKNTADAMSRLSGRRGGGITQYATVTLGGQEQKIARGELMSLYAMDRATRARIDQGSSIQIARGRRRTPIAATVAEIDKATKLLTPKERALVDALKAAIDEQRDALFEAHFRLKGYYPEEVAGYWPSKRNIRFSPNRGLPEGWRGIRERYMENVGFLQEREGGTLPFVVGDAMTVALEHIDATLKVIHLAEATRDAASVMLNPDVVAAVNERWGSGYNRAIEDYLRAISLAQEADMTTMGELVRTMNSNLATAKLGINPGSWLKQLGGLSRLAAQMPTSAYLAGLADWRKIDTAELTRRSGYFWERYVGNIAGRFTPIGGDSYADIGKTTGLLGLEDAVANFLSAIRTGNMRDVKEGFNNLRHAAGTTLEVLNWFDAINARIAYAGWLAEARRKYPAWDAAEQEGWAMSKAAESVRETQNSSSVLDAPLSGIRSRGNVGGSLLIFTSDTLKARNRLEAAKRRGKSEFAKHAAAEALNVLWSRGVSWGVGAGIAATVIALTGGDRDDWEKWREKYLDLDKQLTYGASDILSILDPVVAPTLMRMWQYSFEQFNLPAFEAINNAIRSGISAGTAGTRALEDSRKADDFLVKIAQAANAATAVFGLNPVETVLDRILNQLGDQAEEQPRRQRRETRTRERR